MIIKSLTVVMTLMAMPVSTFAASGTPDWLQERMFASGKINTVVMVVGAVLIGIAIWMVALDRRIGKLEKKEKRK